MCTVWKDINEELADQVVTLCKSKFDSLGKKGKPLENEWTVVSAIVEEDWKGNLQVVALGSGSKCIGRKQLVNDGTILHDSHAEVVARRGFLRYLMHKIKKKQETGLSHLFVDEETNGRFKISPKMRFLMVSSAVPCGDASIIPKVDNGEDDVHRTGAKCLPQSLVQDSKGKGLDYHVMGQVRSKPGRGDPTSSVSCSDKLARWNALGLQGAMLSNIISSPVMLACLIIGGSGPYSEESLERAINIRVDHPCRMKFVQSRDAFHICKSEQRIRPSPCSISWNAGDNKCEASVEGRLLGATKKMKKTTALNISKIDLLRFFTTISMEPNTETLTYRNLKDASKQYQTVWNNLKSKYFLVWSEKPADLENFVVS